MKELTVYFTESKFSNPVNWMIKKFEKSPFTHCAIGLVDHGEVFIYESGLFGVKCMSLEEFKVLNKIVEVVKLNVSDKSYKQIYKNLEQYVGVSYGYCTLLGILFARVSGRRNRFADGDETFICSEYIYKALKDVLKLPSMRPEKDGPKKLYELLKRGDL